ncbi:MAG TPA: Spy/CpxP family protein refolding chaperone [Beijerinckiaceae bacterium]|nr:Spy/CpxP family protein refolding chaperone [Beijerinckiaceae bacterium]
MSRFMQFIKARPITTVVVGAGLVLAGVTAVSAQYGPGWSGGPGWGRGGPGWEGHGWHRGGGMMERGARFARFCSSEPQRYAPVARAWVKADLNLNAGQSAEFDKLADVLLPALEQVKQEACNNFSARSAPAPEKLEKLAAVLRKAADAAEKSVAPAKTFYAQLDEKQKARVEEMTERRGRGHHGWRGGFAAMGGALPIGWQR